MNNLKKIILLLISIVNAAVPKKSNKIVFNSYPDFSDNAFAFFLYVAKLKKPFEIIWLVDKPDQETIYRKMASDYGITSSYRVVKKNSISGLFHYITSKYVFFTHGLYTGVIIPKKHIIVNLWHGMPLKKIGLLDGKPKSLVPRSSFAIATSTLYQKVIADSFGLAIEKVLIVGQPRNDLLLTKTNSLAKLGINKIKYNHIIMWMPTYRKSRIGDIRNDGGNFEESTGLTIDDLFQINETLEQENSLLIIKLHPMDTLSADIFTGYNNFYVIDNSFLEKNSCQLYDILSHADSLITDFSSVYIDFMLTDRPIGFMVYDFEQYSQNRGFVFDRAIHYLPGIIIKDGKGLSDFIKNPEKTNNYKNIKSLFNLRTTNFCEAMYSCVMGDTIDCRSNKNDATS